jgi:tetrahydromethanopterin S-methyltransferase subunit F
MTAGNQRLLVKGVAAGALTGFAVGLIVALLIVVRYFGH